MFPERFPFVPFHELRNLDGVRAWLARHSLEILLHGHIHRPWVVAPTAHGASYAPRVKPPYTAAPGPGVRLSVNSASSSARVRRHDAVAFHRLTLPMEPDAAVHVESLAVE